MHRPASYRLYLCQLLVISCIALAPDSSDAQAYPYPKERALSPVSIPSQTKPGYLDYRIDPTFNTYVRRVSDLASFGGSSSILAHQYATRQAWNADGTKLLLSASYPGWLLDGNTFERIRTINQPHDAVWSNINPNLIYGIGYNGGSYNQLIRLDVEDSDNATVIYTFPGFVNMGIGPYEGNLSNDDRYLVLHGTRAGQSRILTFDTHTNSVLAEMNTGSTFDFAKISQDGSYVVTGHSAIGGGSTSGINVYSRNLVFLRHLTNTMEHGDTGVDAAGDQVWVQYTGASDASVVKWKLSNGSRTPLLSPGSLGVWGGHLSCRNVNRPGWCYLSDNGWDYFSQYWLGNYEILALKLDGSQLVERFAHTHHSYNAGYEHETMGSPDREGRRVIFRSDWQLGSTAEVNSYVAYNSSFVSNGGFEFGLDGWSAFDGSAWQIETIDIYEGSRSLRVITGGGWSNYWSGELSPSKTYRLSVVAKCQDGQGGVYIQFFNENYVQLSQQHIPITTDYYSYSQLLVNPPAGAALLRATVWKNPGTSDLFVDQLMISEF